MERRSIFGEGNFIVHGGEEKRRRKRREIFGEGKYIFAEEKKNGEEKGVKYLEKEILLLAEKEEKRHRDRSVPVGPTKNPPVSGKE